MIAAITAWLAKSALMRSPIGDFLKSVPRSIWMLGIITLLAGGYLWHQHAAQRAIAAAEKRGEDRAYANVERQARELEAKANALNRSIAEQMRKRNDEQARRIAVAADGLRLRGPGAARCTVVAGLPAAPGGRVTPDRPAYAAGSRVPPGDRAAVPWSWLVERAEQADLNRAEALAWRDWYARFKAEWDRWNAKAAVLRPGSSQGSGQAKP